MLTGPIVDIENLAPDTVLLDKYRIVRTLGIGGMGAVYLAEHIELRKAVALKFLLPVVAKVPDMAERFMREARAASQVAGEYVAAVLDVGRLSDGTPFMVMEYLEGEDLQSYRESHPNMPIEEAIEYVVQAGAALISAHRLGIVHRDVKPANFFLVRRGDGSSQIKVLDFGISKFTAEGADNSITKTTAVMGSAAYMSPEQMRSTKNVDQRTDIYALGVCLYELLAGTQPYVADSPLALATKVSTDPPEPIATHRADVPSSLALVLEKAYAKRQDDRYSDVGAFLLALAPHASEGTRARIKAIVGVIETGPSKTSLMPSAKARAEEGPEIEATAIGDAASPTTITTRSEAVARSRSRGARAAAGVMIVGIGIVGWIALDRTRQDPAVPRPTSSTELPPSAGAQTPPSPGALTIEPTTPEPPAIATRSAPPSVASAAPAGSTMADSGSAAPVPIATSSASARPPTILRPPTRPKFCTDSNNLRVPCK